MRSAPGTSASLRGNAAAGLRLAAFLAWTGIVAVTWALLRPCLRRRAKVRWAARFTSAWGRGTLLFLGLRVSVAGRPPTPPFVLAANHLGYLDIAVLSAHAPCAFVAKSEVASWPLFGILASLSGSLFIDRAHAADAMRVNRLIGERMEEGGGLALFPEGTSTGGDTLPFRSPLLAHPASARMPVHYAALSYRLPAGGEPASQAMCWWGEVDFLPHFLNLFRLRGMEARLAFGPAPLRCDDRKRLAADLREAVTKLMGYVTLELPSSQAPSEYPARRTA